MVRKIAVSPVEPTPHTPEDIIKQQLFEKTALVTGGSTGIGRAAAEALAQHGAQVAIIGRARTRGEEAARITSAESEGEVVYIQADVSRDEEVEALVKEAVDTFGGLDFVFNNAGIEGPVKPVPNWSKAECDQVLDVNAKGPFLVMKHTIPRLLECGGGTIVNTASFVGTVVALPTAVLYGATKAAVLSMTTSVAAAHGNQGLRAFAVCPWMTDTPMLERLTNGRAEVRNQYISANPSGEVVRPKDVAEVVVSMFSGDTVLENSGAVLVDRGGTMQRLQFPVPVTEEVAARVR